VNDLVADLRHPAPILILETKDPPDVLPSLTLGALRAGGLLARRDDLCYVYGKQTGKLPIWYITPKRAY
jgi:hypothetical protein